MANFEGACVEPVSGVKYPVKVDYCGNCAMPFEVSNEGTNYIRAHARAGNSSKW